MHKLFIVFGFALLAAGSAMAQKGPTFEVAAAYQYVHVPGASCQGFGGNAAVNVNRWLGVAGDFGFCKVTGLPSGASSHLTNYLFGPRISARNYGRVTPYTQFLLGGEHNTLAVTGTSFPSANAFAFTLGGGTDVRLTPHVSFRAIQFEYLYTHFGGTKQNNLRIQTGLVYRFGGK
jgi:opacity protein-like surface antigen